MKICGSWGIWRRRPNLGKRFRLFRSESVEPRAEIVRGFPLSNAIPEDVSRISRFHFPFSFPDEHLPDVVVILFVATSFSHLAGWPAPRACFRSGAALFVPWAQY